MSAEQSHFAALRKGRFSSPGTVYFITSNVLNRQPILTPLARDIIIASLNWSCAAGRLWLLGYAVMDDHFHTLFSLRDTSALAWVMNSIKRHCARQINLKSKLVGELWQDGYHDHAIRDEADFWHHVSYLHENPVRRKWVERAEDYAWSTAHQT